MTTRRRRGERGMAPATARAIALFDTGKASARHAAITHGIDPTTIYRALRRRRERAALKCTAADAPETAAKDIKNGGSNAE